MAKEKNRESEDEAPVAKPPKKDGGNKLLVIIILLLVVIIVGGGAYVFLLKGPSDNVPPQMSEALIDQSGAAAQQQQGHLPKEDPGPVVTYSPFTVNLADPGGNRYLKVTISVELSKEKNFPNEISAKEPRIKDIILSILSSKMYEEINTYPGKLALKQEMMRKLNAVMSGGRITDIYITEFVVQ
ncbi:MAG: flagellar basal body-associated FliL family protein [Deferribacteraceae bacterium]|jgi:flagellar FliL protein|nr:flagellar basal body-associated FliL family protein [Deferribacteraceae bacterium]